MWARQNRRRFDASNMLKLMLARGEIHCIGATTLKEYREYIKKIGLRKKVSTDSVEEPTVEDTITIKRFKIGLNLFMG